MEHQKPAKENNGGGASGFLVSLDFDDVDHLLACLGPGAVGADRAAVRGRPRRVNRAVEIARNRANVVHSVGELAKLTGVSERTLRRGFHERFDTSPKAYLQAQRLIGVRRELRGTGPEVPINDIANAWGFWHMGQFAADYRRQFGELPSQTLRCAKI